MFSDANDKTLITFFISATLLTVIFVFFLIVSLVRLRSRQRQKEELLLHALIDERERTMSTVSAEIHDNVNQALSLARMALKMAGKYAVAEQHKYMAQCEQMLSNAIGDLRSISHSLNTQYIRNRGLLETLEEMVKWMNVSKDINCKLIVEGDYQPFKPDIELMVIRIAQEAIQNTIKHANASQFSIMLVYTKGAFQMRIMDDGSGFAIDPEAPWTGVGLQSMYERSRIIQGHIEISSVRGGGTSIILKLENPKRIKLPG